MSSAQSVRMARSELGQIDANELVDLLLQMHFLKQSGEQLMLESNANDENGWAWNQIKVTRGKTVSYFTRIG